MIRVVLDTNIYISAILFGGKPEHIIDLAREGEIEVYISEPILTEIERILGEKLNQPAIRIQQALADIKSLTKYTAPKVRVREIRNHDADNRILECAAQEAVDFLVSGDTKHLQPVKKFRGTTIVGPAEFLERLANRS